MLLWPRTALMTGVEVFLDCILTARECLSECVPCLFFCQSLMPASFIYLVTTECNVGEVNGCPSVSRLWLTTMNLQSVSGRPLSPR